MLNLAILAAVALTLAMLFHPRVLGSQTWRATVTPLASIIGSGFLILGPILEHSYGGLAPVVMFLLCAVAWAFGAAIRTNISRIGDDDPPATSLETASSWALAAAYIVSVAYYLNLFGSFAVRLTPFDTDIAARLTTTAMFLLILGVGWSRGFSALEAMETLSVGLKLAIIAGFLVALAWYNVEEFETGALIYDASHVGGWHAVTLAFGLIVTVQGFETSRYLGKDYDAETRVRTMQLAQAIAAAIYVIYILLVAYAFADKDVALDEAAIVDMMTVVAPILPVLLVVAALSAQFSAAVADTGGSGGLIAELTGGRLSVRAGYALLVGAGLAITWSFGVFQIVGYASRAFALYYALQSFIAAKNARSTARATGFYALALLGALMAIFGDTVE